MSMPRVKDGMEYLGLSKSLVVDVKVRLRD